MHHAAPSPYLRHIGEIGEIREGLTDASVGRGLSISPIVCNLLLQLERSGSGKGCSASLHDRRAYHASPRLSRTDPFTTCVRPVAMLSSSRLEGDEIPMMISSHGLVSSRDLMDELGIKSRRTLRKIVDQTGLVIPRRIQRLTGYRMFTEEEAQAIADWRSGVVVLEDAA